MSTANDIALAREAAELVVNARRGVTSRPIREPDTIELADAAVARLAELFAELPAAFSEALEGSADSGEMTSTDRLQGVSEVVQNADDVAATTVRIMLHNGSLLLAHDGQPVELRNVLALATPFLTTKRDDSRSTGRFGIGLMTLRSLTTSLEVHSTPYHIRLGKGFVSSVTPFVHPPNFAEPHWTVLRIPLDREPLTSDELATWLDRWNDSALLFLRHVRRIELLDRDQRVARELALQWDDYRMCNGLVGKEPTTVSVGRATNARGDRWLRYSAEVTSPTGLSRARKAAEPTTPIAVALPLQTATRGMLHAGLPVVEAVSSVWVNAQFDPLSSRQDLSPTLWNSALLELAADLWAVGLVDLFKTDAAAAWAVTPLPELDTPAADPRASVQKLELLLVDRSRESVGPAATIAVAAGELPLSGLAIESPRLEGVLEPQQIASLCNLSSVLPRSARDAKGRWRLVVNDWRHHGVELPEELGVHRALNLLEQLDLPNKTVIGLSAAAIDSGLATELSRLAMVIDSDGRRLVPPGHGSDSMLLVSPNPLAEQLGIGVRLHRDHLASNSDARVVLDWLRKRGALVDTTDSIEVLRRIAAAGDSGATLPQPLTDSQANALRESLEALPVAERPVIGASVGRAVLLRGYTYKRGKKVGVPVRPSEAFLPKAIEKDQDTFADAAMHTPGLQWVEGRYAEILRSRLGRSAGLGPTRFLKALGVETGPRIRQHPDLYRRYSSDGRRGLSIDASPLGSARRAAMDLAGATYTLEDFDSPDLKAVIEDIAKDRSGPRRRQRSAALLATLARRWDGLADFEQVTAASDYQGWNQRGELRSSWLWDAAQTSWLDDTSGKPRRPIDLRLRTAGAVAVYGEQVAYLRPELDSPNRREVLAALGVTGEPTTKQLVDRLVDIRSNSKLIGYHGDTSTEVAVIYIALAEHVGRRGRSTGDMSAEQLRRAFSQSSGLVFTSGVWRRPDAVLAGPAVFGRYHHFVPPVPNTEPLWRTLNVRQPSFADAVRALESMARTRKPLDVDDEAVLLETLRLMGQQIHTQPRDGSVVRGLAKAPVWTSRGWVVRRPVYACDDPSLVRPLSDVVPIWRPGGGLEQFRSLLPYLRVTELAASDFAVVASDYANVDEDATDLFRRAVQLLREDLARNDPRAVMSLAVDWGDLELFTVKVDGDLTVALHKASAGMPATLAVDAKMDIAHASLFVREPELTFEVDAGGRAMASLFDSDNRRIAHAWIVACANAQAGRRSAELKLAAQRSAEQSAAKAADLEQRTRDLLGTIDKRSNANAGASPKATGSPASTAPRLPDASSTRPTENRALVDPDSLQLINPLGRIVGSPPTGSARTQSAPVPTNATPAPPNRSGSPPRSRTGPPGYVPVDKETVGLDLVRKVLGGNSEQIVDLRAQRGVGADAIDELDQFYELKVSAGPEPEKIALTSSEVQRAVNDPNFFIAVVSNVEGPSAKPTVRIIVDPLDQLRAVESGGMVLAGVRDSYSVVFDFSATEPATEPTAENDVD